MSQDNNLPPSNFDPDRKPPLMPGLSPQKKLTYGALAGATIILVIIALFIKINNDSQQETTVVDVEQEIAKQAQENSTPVENTDQPLRIGQAAPGFTQKEVSPGNGEVSLSDYRGQPVLLEFIATWCPHCQAMAPMIADTMSSQDKVQYLMIGAADETDQAVAQFHNDFNGVKSPGKAINADQSVIDDYSLAGYPTLVFVNSNGKINYLYAGEINQQLLKEQLNNLK
jgi:thiol-disulfide isomerase/thioredoxin